MEILVGDIGGTHARFALAQIDDGQLTGLGEAHIYQTARFPSLEAAVEAFAQDQGRALPRAVGLAVACPVTGEVLKLTNNPWVLRPARMREGFASERLVLINDFGAVAHAAAQLGPEDFQHVCGPGGATGPGVATIVGPGTGLGVAQLLRRADGYTVIETEGGHIGFSPQDPVEEALLAHLRNTYGRVSAERVLQGSGLGHIVEVLAGQAGISVAPREPAELWTSALSASDALTAEALSLYCRMFGAVSGDLALAHGAEAVVLAGGLGARLAGRLAASRFQEGFVAKGRFSERMAAIPVRLITHPQPGLFGAAAAFAQALGRS